MSAWIATAARNTASGTWARLSHLFHVLLVLLWDTGLTLLNVFLPRKPRTPTEWPEFVPPTASDSRSPCPALNALASHGLLPHNGRGIKFTELAARAHEHYNFAPSFCYYTCNFMAGILHRNYYTDTLDLADLCLHNGIEYDSSITRYDTHQQPDQSVPAEKLIHELLAASQDGKKLTTADISRVMTARRSHSKATNPQFSLDGTHSLFSASNAATLIVILGGEVETLKSFLLEERIPEGWTSVVRSRMGLTMASFNVTTLRVLLGVDPKWKNVKVLKKDV